MLSKEQRKKIFSILNLLIKNTEPDRIRDKKNSLYLAQIPLKSIFLDENKTDENASAD